MNVTKVVVVVVSTMLLLTHPATAVPTGMTDDQVVILSTGGSEITRKNFGDGSMVTVFSINKTDPAYVGNPANLNTTFFLVEDQGGMKIKSDEITLMVSSTGDPNTLSFTLSAISFGEVWWWRIPLGPFDTYVYETGAPQEVSAYVFAYFGTAPHPWGETWVLSQEIPAPGAVLLGSIGVGLVGWLRRRRTF